MSRACHSGADPFEERSAAGTALRPLKLSRRRRVLDKEHKCIGIHAGERGGIALECHDCMQSELMREPVPERTGEYTFSSVSRQNEG